MLQCTEARCTSADNYMYAIVTVCELKQLYVCMSFIVCSKEKRNCRIIAEKVKRCCETDKKCLGKLIDERLGGKQCCF